MTPDQMDMMNGCFELFGALLQFISIYRLTVDKEVKGVSLIPAFFFTVWGFFNLFFYPSCHLMFSMAGAVIMFGSNFVWLFLALWYRKG